MIERLLLILKMKNISASKFADEIGVQRSSISHILSGRNNPSLDVVQKILKRFPDINPEWLLAGKGPMIKEKVPDLFDSINDQEANISNQQSYKKDKEKSNAILNPSETFINIASRHFQNDDEKIENPANNKSSENKNINGFNKTNVNSSIINKTISQNENLSGELKVSDSLIPEGKKIDKIIIFYTDHTFSLYKPIN